MFRRQDNINISSFVMVRLSVFQIVQVGLVLIGLFLETDMEIGFLPIPIFDVQDEPFYAIPDEERYI